MMLLVLSTVVVVAFLSVRPVYSQGSCIQRTCNDACYGKLCSGFFSGKQEVDLNFVLLMLLNVFGLISVLPLHKPLLLSQEELNMYLGYVSLFEQ